MKYEELVERVREEIKDAWFSKGLGHVAFQFNVEGEAEGAFYIELSDGKINVEPYEYYDRDIVVVTSAEILLQMVEGKLAPMAAYANGQIKVYGNVETLKLLPINNKPKKSES
ncbi:MAG: SCP2 sterol-binding domain-containing protein [Lachnospiraceae bacterium]|nr:SCP2 sterol-binding domain-containing protein [Lachnospiraceae bacterium]